MKNKAIYIRASTDELNTIRQKAHNAKMNVSQYVLSAALDKPIVIIDGVREFNKELRRIGININQIAVLCNMGKIKCANLEATQAAIDKIGADINRLRRDVKRE